MKRIDTCVSNFHDRKKVLKFKKDSSNKKKFSKGKGTKQHLAEGFTVFCGPPTTLERPLLKAAVQSLAGDQPSLMWPSERNNQKEASTFPQARSPLPLGHQYVCPSHDLRCSGTKARAGLKKKPNKPNPSLYAHWIHLCYSLLFSGHQLTRNLPKKWKPLCQRSGPCIQCKWYWPSAAVRKLPLQARDAVANMSMEEPSPQWSQLCRRSMDRTCWGNRRSSTKRGWRRCR